MRAMASNHNQIACYQHIKLEYIKKMLRYAFYP